MSSALLHLPSKHAATLELLVCAFERAGGLLPEAETALRVLCGPQAPANLAEEVRRLVALGVLRRVFVGREAHLLLASDASSTGEAAARSHARPDSGHPESEQVEQLVAPTADEAALQEHGRQVELDVLRERLLLYRVVVAVEVILALVIARGALLYVIG